MYVKISCFRTFISLLYQIPIFTIRQKSDNFTLLCKRLQDRYRGRCARVRRYNIAN